MTATPEVVRVLEEARARVAKGWCRRAYARDADGMSVWATDTTATKWCVRGAVLAGRLPYGDALVCLAKVGVNDDIQWNDAPGRTQAEVLAAFDRAIALAAEPTP